MTRSGPSMTTASMDRILDLVHKETSMKARMGYTLLLLLSLGMVVLVCALWWTEPSLPLRTQLAFGAMAAIGVCWVMFCGWVLSRRRPLFALDRVVAGRMAVVFTTVFLLAGSGIGLQRGHWPGTLAVALLGATLVGVAMVTLRRAHLARAALLRRRDELAALVGPA